MRLYFRILGCVSVIPLLFFVSIATATPIIFINYFAAALAALTWDSIETHVRHFHPDYIATKSIRRAKRIEAKFARLQKRIEAEEGRRWQQRWKDFQAEQARNKKREETMTAPITTPPPLPTEDTPMVRLRIVRSQRSRLGGGVSFIVEARALINEDYAQLVRKYNLTSDVVYMSEAGKQNAQIAAETGKGRVGLLRGSFAAAMAAVALRITVGSLLGGQRVECKTLGEAMNVELAVLKACENLKEYILAALTYDGSEQIVEI